MKRFSIFAAMLILASAVTVGCRKSEPCPQVVCPECPPPCPPKPPEPPKPVSAGGFVVVEETAEATQARAVLLTDARVHALIKALGLSHKIVDKDAKDAKGNVPSAVAKYLEAAKGKKLPRLFVVAADGSILSERDCPMGPAEFVAAFDSHKGPRKLGLKVADKPLKARWKKFGDSPSAPIIPRSQWKDVDMSAFLPPVHDQDGVGQCACDATTGAIETARAIAGLPYVQLSAADLYDRVNGGADNGSLLEDCMAEICDNGVAPASMVPPVWTRPGCSNVRGVVEERKKYRALEVYVAPNFDAYVSALNQGFIGVHGLMWCDNYSNTDSMGRLPIGCRGGAGGHALFAYGAKNINGKWYILTRNSWSPAWGVGGNCLIPEADFGRDISGWFLIRAVTYTDETPAAFAPEIAH